MVEGHSGDDPRGTSRGGAAGGPDEAALADRLQRLGASLEARTAAAEPKDSRGRTPGFAKAVKVASEFVAGIAVGVGIGWLIDRVAGTAPWGLIIFLFLGFAAGVLNVLRSEGMVADAAYRRPPEKKDGGSSS
jgi:ATP synthase protein I